MAVPAVYIVVGAVAVVAVGFAFKEFVYDPHIKPAVDDWLEQRRAERANRRRNNPYSYHSDSDSDDYDDDDDVPLMNDARSSGLRSFGSGPSQLRQRGPGNSTGNGIRLETFNDGRGVGQWLDGVRNPGSTPSVSSTSPRTAKPINVSEIVELRQRQLANSRGTLSAARSEASSSSSATVPGASSPHSLIDGPNPWGLNSTAPRSEHPHDDFLASSVPTHILFDPSVPPTPSTITARSVQASRASSPPPPAPPLPPHILNALNSSQLSNRNQPQSQSSQLTQQQLPELISPLPIRVSSIPTIPHSSPTPPPVNQEQDQSVASSFYSSRSTIGSPSNARVDIETSTERSQTLSPTSSHTRSSSSPVLVPALVPVSVSSSTRVNIGDSLASINTNTGNHLSVSGTSTAVTSPTTPTAARVLVTARGVPSTTASTTTWSPTSSPPLVQSLSHSYPFHHADTDHDVELISPPSSRSLSPFSTVSDAGAGNSAAPAASQNQTSPPVVPLSSAASAYLSFSSIHSDGPGSSRSSTGTLSPDIIAPSRSPSLSPVLHHQPQPAAAAQAQAPATLSPSNRRYSNTGNISDFSDLEGDIESGMSDVDAEVWSSPELRPISRSELRSPEAFYNIVRVGSGMGGAGADLSASLSDIGRERSGSESEGWESVRGTR
ncbi:hypothetical protein AX16_007379 [Volvariella volvacea WC 439]|nr:hypothetical protein AX16_007379 [Volvariella volvacea WC 439]